MHTSIVKFGVVPPGIKITEIVVGTGAAVERGKLAVAHIKGYLNRGEQFCNTHEAGQPVVMDLSKRDQVAGIRKGIEGMRVGGKRELIVSPHLAYGKEGVPGSIPPNAVVRFEVELLDVCDQSAPPTCAPPGRQLLVFRPGEAARNMARWQFGVRESPGEKTVAGVYITWPVPGATWRHALGKSYELSIEASLAKELFNGVEETFKEHPEACLENNQMWADASEKANSITRDHADVLCLTVGIWDGGRSVLYYGLPETSPVLLNSKFYQIISTAVAPYLANVPNR